MEQSLLPVRSRSLSHADDGGGSSTRMFAATALPGLLHTVSRRMNADIAVLLRVDASANLLHVADSHGLDNVARAAIRIAVGQGFAGAIAATGRPTVVDNLPAGTLTDSVYPDLALAGRLGITSVLGVPIVDDGRVHSVLYVGARSAGTLALEQAPTLRALADRLHASDAVRRNSEDDMAALVLQRSLLPSTPAHVPGLDLAARYLPADGNLGGDWFDVFELPGDRVGLVMGDVAGHGLHPAIVMGRLRSALRAYALDYDDPATVLTHLNRKITHFEAGVFATVLFGMSRHPYDTVEFSSAGHLPPAIARPDRPTTLTEVLPDPPLGVRAAVARHNTAVELRSGESLCLYTDGLVERIRAGGWDQHHEGLTALRTHFTAEPAEAAASAIIDGVLQGATDDDVAILVARRD